ncbi:type II and III secretion system protein family protein [Jannaschia ovalis]|uniref:Type II and III secretion system protein family protein n=1 Tax=Jannaschia ovalis TaxID=3038773 RepID=A0ABY8LDD1_9RHOB|nr:type II and III secretion system protein family protein [Jannaschia sp. GRR-S6-38]WGH79331.1 type II and III secretion system protein family protein [Jannaschia sp. GRR-S6-38]
MKIRTILRASMLALMLSGTSIAGAHAQTLRLAEGQTQGALRVPLNRALVLESELPFAELSVANPLIADIATLSERTVYVLGKAPGRTTLTLLGPDGRLITNVEVQVIPDIAEFKERLRELLPGEQIEVRTANDGIVLSGTVSSSQKLDQALEVAQRYAPDAVLNLMSVGGVQQVQLKVRFAEMSRSVTKELGSNLSLNASSGDEIFTGSTSTGLASSTGTATFSFGGGSYGVTLALQALESKGLVRTLAEPNLTALSGQAARFLAGGEYPIPVQGAEGQVSVEYRPFGVELQFTPTVVDQDIINLVLDASVSAIDTTIGATIGDTAVDGFTQRQTSTTIEMRDGQSIAIAGILQDEFRDGTSSVPWLGDVPILGALFRSADYRRSQTELVIIITANLVTPVSGEALALPTDRIRPPTENELFLFGRISGGAQNATRRSTRGGEAAAQDFSGNYGYVME